MQTFDLKTTRREEMIDVTSQVRQVAKQVGAQNGLVCVFCPHTTAGVTIQENTDPDVKSDMVAHLAKVVPQAAGFKHSEDNSDAHIKSSIVGSSVTVILAGGRLMLGHWQAIFFCEFDGPRDRRVQVKVIPG